MAKLTPRQCAVIADLRRSVAERFEAEEAEADLARQQRDLAETCEIVATHSDGRQTCHILKLGERYEMRGTEIDIAVTATEAKKLRDTIEIIMTAIKYR